MFNSDTDIAGFQFHVTGVDVTGAGGGAAEAAGFTVSTGNNTVLGFSLQGTTIPAGEGVLVVLDVAGGGDACLEDVIISDSSGNALDTTVEDCTTISIGDDCPSGNYDCAGICDGDAVEDCAGDCGGSAEVDECGVCNGDGPEECWDGSTACDASDCPDQPGGSVEVYYNTSTPIAGFQFNVDGVSITGSGGGAAADAGFTVSNSASTVVGFSLTGATIPAGEGVLIVLEVDGNTSDACLSGLVLSDSNGSAIDAMVEGCTSIVEEGDDDIYGCMDMDACNYNADATMDDGSCDYGSMCWDGSYECDASDCPDQPGETSISFGVVGDSALEVLLSNDSPVAGLSLIHI